MITSRDAVMNQRPVATITYPLTYFTSFKEGQQLDFIGFGSDHEDGGLSDESLTWVSNIDGVIGTGPNVTTTELSPGGHEITLRVTDTEGAIGERTIFIRVDELVAEEFVFQPELNTIPVTFEGRQLLYPFMGGLDSGTIDLGDLDGDGDEDLVFLGTNNNDQVYFFRNNGLGASPQFSYETSTLIGLYVYQLNGVFHPELADIDGDGDLDLFIGSGFLNPSRSNLLFFENIGTSTHPDFVLAQQDYAGIVFTEPLSPEFADLDNDGDLDLVVSEEFGEIRFYRNTGTVASANFEEDAAFIPELSGIAGSGAPSFADFDADGDLDLMILGNAVGSQFDLYRNTGSVSLPQFTLVESNFVHNAYGGSRTRAVFSDVDVDGDVDIMMGSSSGTLLLSMNEGSPSNPVFVQPNDYLPILPFLDEGFQSSISLDDLDNDGDLDLMRRSNMKGIELFRNTGSASSPAFVQESVVVEEQNEYAHTTVDIDADGDVDLFTMWGTSEGSYINFYRNEGSVNNPNFVFVTNDFQNTRDSQTSVLATFVDIDNDGDYDMFTGKEDGTITFFRNSGTPQNPVLARETENYASIDVGIASSPHFADIDLDGDFDLFVGEQDGPISFYRNVGTPENGSFSLVTSNFADASNFRITPYLRDIDDDNDLDLFAFGGRGGVWFYRQRNQIPSIRLSSTSPTFEETVIGGERRKLITVINDGLAPLNVEEITSNLPDFSASPSSFTLLPLKGRTVEIIFQPTRSGVISGALAFTSDDPAAPFLTLNVTGTGRLSLLQDATSQAALTGIASGTLGLSFNDYNNDGTLDFFAASPNGHQLFRNNGGSFVDVTTFSGITSSGASGSVFFDPDNDGNLDMLAGGKLFRNNGNETFTDITTFAGLGGSPTALATGDYNRDGWTDVLLVEEAARLYENQGDGTFVDVTSSAGLSGDVGLSNSVLFSDYDGDGNLDVFFARNEESSSGLLYRNNGDGTFTDVTGDAGLDGTGNSQGAVFGDLDNDGDQDLLIGRSSPEVPLWYRNTGNGVFEQVSSGLGLESLPVSVHPVLADFDNDGLLDVLLLGPTNHLLRNQGDWTFSDVSESLDLGSLGSAISGVVGDYDGDGDLDIFATGEENPGVLLNNEGNANHWLKVELESDALNRDGIGARIRVVAGDLVQTRYVAGSLGNGTQAPLTAHLGLGLNTEVDSIVVTWPMGNKDIVTGVPVDDVVQVSQTATSVSVTPVTLTFGDVLVDQSEMKALTVRNFGSSVLEVTSLAVSGNGSASYSLDTSPFSVGITEEREVDVTFNPSAAGSAEATLTLETSERTVEIALRGFGNVAPVVNSALPDLLVQLGEDATIIDLLAEPNVFTDGNGDSLQYTVTSNTPDVATAALVAGRFIELVGVRSGTSMVQVEASDGRGASTQTAFSVQVNTPPAATDELLSISLEVGGDSFTRDLLADPAVFNDEDGDVLTISAESSNPLVATANIVSNRTLDVAVISRGVATITVSADDGNEGLAVTSFQVTDTETNTSPVITNPGDQTSDEGESVSLTLMSVDPQGQGVNYEASGLPPDLNISSSGVISGILSDNAAQNSPYTVSVIATDTGTPPLQSRIQFSWVVDQVLMAASAPTGLTAMVEEQRIVLQWNANPEANIVNYRIYRKSGAEAEVQIGEVAGDSTSYADSDVVEGTTYTYRITAFNDEGIESDFSSEIMSQLFPEGPGIPLGLMVQPAPNAIRVSWEAVAGAQHYNVYRYQNPDPPALLQREVSGLVYIDTTAVAGQLFFYRVTAVDAFGQESAFSSGSGTESFGYPSVLALQASLSFADPTLDESSRMVGLPGQLNLDVAETFDGQFGEDWDAYADNGDAVNYLRAYNASNRLAFRPGIGYWVISRSPWRVDTSAAPVTLNEENGFVISYRPGWNIISNPFEVRVDWGDVQAANGIPDSLWRYNGAYQVSSQLIPNEGYYIFNRDDAIREITIPYPGASAGKDQVAGKSSAADRLVVELKAGEVVKSHVAVGVHPEASVTLDDHDQLAPPGGFSTARLLIENEELEIDYKKLAMEYRPEIGEGQKFDLVLDVPKGELVSVGVPDLSVFGDFEVQIVDVSTGKFTDLHEIASFGIRGSGIPMKLKLLIGTRSYIDDQRTVYLPKEFVLEGNYPNPFRHQTTIVYAIPGTESEVDVQLEVFDMLGRRVAVLVDGVQRAGYHQVQWDGRSQTGKLASGTYVYRLVARGSDSVVLSRPVVLLK